VVLGAAYVFVESGGTWSQQAELTAPDGAAYDFFGGSVAVSGSTARSGCQGSTHSARMATGIGVRVRQKQRNVESAGGADRVRRRGI
jgi:hypothetical protein